MGEFQPVLTRIVGREGSRTLAVYEREGGYRALKKAVELAPARSSSRSRSRDSGAEEGRVFPRG